MRKRLAIMTITALTALGGVSAATASMKPAPSHNPNCAYDLACKA